jgi:hypothetical protein
MDTKIFENLQKSSEERLKQLMFEADQLQLSLEKIEKTKIVFEQINITLDNITGFENLIKYRLFLGIVSMD